MKGIVLSLCDFTGNMTASRGHGHDHVFDPCDYGDPWAKRTCLWSGGALDGGERDAPETTDRTDAGQLDAPVPAVARTRPSPQRHAYGFRASGVRGQSIRCGLF
jgi:hypothetical protein